MAIALPAAGPRTCDGLSEGTLTCPMHDDVGRGRPSFTTHTVDGASTSARTGCIIQARADRCGPREQSRSSGRSLTWQGGRAKLADYSAAAGDRSVCWGKGRAEEGAPHGGGGLVGGRSPRAATAGAARAGNKFGNSTRPRSGAAGASDPRARLRHSSFSRV
ncbi:hypothetical protein HPB50_013004 [Hyalomma asiaticum]|uniref:Uncharacterized protein n=1 Tax=Hyalomma asiaticum TaxID=266040 RepID=A0ACB7SC78_HYAAI|nr:hypothetical protein HPB50_013004 [Hyalomma asiaticum]